MCRFADMLGLKYSYYVNDNRYHGFEIPAGKLEGYLVISSDFTILRNEVEVLVKNNIALISTDHHDVEDEFIDIVGETAEGIVINNQYPFEPKEDRYLSGAGVFYEAACEIFPEFKSRELEALVGITLLSDIREIENNKARSYLRKTYAMDTSEGYINYLVMSVLDSDFAFGVPKLDRNFIDYTLSPCINAMLRANRTDEVVRFVLGYGLEDNSSAKELQKSLLRDMEERAQICEFPNVVFLVCNTVDFLDYNVSLTNYIGYFCSDYKDKHNNISTLGLVVDNGYVIRASFRGRYEDIHYLSGFRHLGIDAHGHPGAFGIQNFFPETQTWYDIDELISQMEENHTQTAKIISSSNLGFIMNRDGTKIATENCYVRDMFRTYIKYTGENYKVLRESFVREELTREDYINKVVADEIVSGRHYKYVRDANGVPKRKYIEYLVDGKKVKSFGVSLKDGLILPILERGYIQLYVRNSFK